MYNRPAQIRRFYIDQIRDHRIISGILGINVIAVLAAAIWHGRTRQALAYLAAVAISVVVIDAVSLSRGKPPEVPVRGPRLEFLALIGFWVTALAWLAGRFVFNYQPRPGLPRLAMRSARSARENTTRWRSPEAARRLGTRTGGTMRGL
jgi:hypothetical protein